MGFTKGSERLLYIKVAGQWVLVCSLTVNSFDEEIESLATTTRANAGWATARLGLQSYQIGFSGFQVPTETARVSYDLLKELKRSKTLIEWKLEAFASNFIDIGKGYITSLSENAAVGDLLTFEASIQGYGEPTDFADVEAPTAPFLNPITDFDINYVTLTWDPSTDNIGIAGYDVRITDNSGDRIVTLGNVLTYTDMSVRTGRYYSYNVRAFDGAGNYSDWTPKRLIFIPIPSGGVEPNYFLLENGNELLTETGEPLILE